MTKEHRSKVFLEILPAQVILQAVADRLGFTVAEIRGDGRHKALVHARWVAMRLLMRAGRSAAGAGRALNDRDHSTVCHSIRQLPSRVRSDPALAKALADLEQFVDERARSWQKDMEEARQNPTMVPVGARPEDFALKPKERPFVTAALMRLPPRDLLAQLDAEIAKLRRMGWTQKSIAKRFSTAPVSYISASIKRIDERAA